MTWIAAGGAGAGMGLAYFGGLWVTVRGVMRRPGCARWIPLCGLARLALLGAGLVFLGRLGAGSLLAALGGLWLSRWLLIRAVGGAGDGK